jgi:protein-tyrosine-phosphatase
MSREEGDLTRKTFETKASPEPEASEESQTSEASKLSSDKIPAEPAVNTALQSVRPQAVLFACGLNSLRSPMAASLMGYLFKTIYVRSAGVRKGDLDHFAASVMDEIGLDISKHRPMTFEDLEDWEGLNFDLIITLAPEAHHRALELTRSLAVDVEYWPIPDPSDTSGNREQRLDAYRAVRDLLMQKITERFAEGAKATT